MTERVATLSISLRGFAKADTTSQFEGWLEPGRYVVLEERSRGHDRYARLFAPALGAGDTWICTRSRGQDYAKVQDARPVAAPELHATDGLTIPESALVETSARFSAFTYDLDEARYPFALAGVTVPLAPPLTNNCCTFVEALLVGAWQGVHGGFVWSAERHRQMMILSRDDYFSPVTAAVESGMGVAAPEGAAPRPWTLVQGWREMWNKGHTFLVVAHHEPSDRVLTLESNSSYGLDGVGWREIGNLRDQLSPPEHWWENESLWTWR